MLQYLVRPRAIICLCFFSSQLDALCVGDVGCARSAAERVRRPPPPPNLKGRFLHLTDMHPDPLYRVGVSESSACHRKKPKKETERGAYYGLP